MPTNDALRPILKSQLRAALAMLKDTIEKCPDELWLDAENTNRCWQIAYHTLFYAHLYLHKDPHDVTRWPCHQTRVQVPGALGIPRPDADKSLPVYADPIPARRFWRSGRSATAW